MPTLKVLYVDDHIPDDTNLDEEDEIKTTLRKQHPKWGDAKIDEWSRVYYNACQVIKTLEGRYVVTTANRHQDAMQFAKNSHFDIAIVDIGWFDDETLSKRKKAGNAGWEICDKIKETDQKSNSQPTLQIAYSNRFEKEPELSSDALGRGVLPFFKTRETLLTHSFPSPAWEEIYYLGLFPKLEFGKQHKFF